MPTTACRYGKDCKTNNCTYQHPDAKGDDSSASLKKRASSASETVCKYGADCRTNNCRYKHSDAKKAKPAAADCRYGSDCRTRDCKYSHPKKQEEKDDSDVDSASEDRSKDDDIIQAALKGELSKLQRSFDSNLVLKAKGDFKCDIGDIKQGRCIHAAAASGNIQLLVWLVGDVGVDIDTRNVDKLCALHIASKQKDTAVVAWLIKAGAGVNFKSLNGQTPLHFAASVGSTTCCKMLVDSAQADVSIQDNDGKTAYAIAKAANHDACSAVLL